MLKYKKMHSRFLKLFFGTLVMSILFIGCQKETDTYLTQEEQMMKFDSYEDFLDQTDKLTQTEIEKKCSDLNIKSCTTEDTIPFFSEEVLKYMPLKEIAFFNENGEVLINDSVHFLHNNEIYKIPKEDNSLISKVKNHEIVLDPFVTYEVSTLQPSELKTLGLGGNSGCARHQKEFRLKSYLGRPHSVRMKYVHEIVTWTRVRHMANVDIAFSKVSMNIKLEYKHRRRWKSAGEKRDIKCNFTSHCHFVNTNFKIQSRVNENFNNSKDKTLTLAWYDGPVYANIGWHITVDGTVYQMVKGDSPSNAWTNRVKW